jgi:hypothetical protein
MVPEEPLPLRRRRAVRYGLNRNVQLQLSNRLSIFARATDISRSGIRLHVHGNTVPGQRFRVIFRPGGDTEEGASAEVRWVGRSNLDGVRPVGLAWLDENGAARPRIDAFVAHAQEAH